MSLFRTISERAIITNNPAVIAAFPMESCHIKGSVREVFTAVRNAVHKGAQIISHPLNSSIKPNESPYKSVVITVATGKLDIKSLNIIEDAISLLNRLPDKNCAYDESVLDDFRIIDLDLIRHIFEPVPGDLKMIDMLRRFSQ